MTFRFPYKKTNQIRRVRLKATEFIRRFLVVCVEHIRGRGSKRGELAVHQWQCIRHFKKPGVEPPTPHHRYEMLCVPTQVRLVSWNIRNSQESEVFIESLPFVVCTPGTRGGDGHRSRARVGSQAPEIALAMRQTPRSSLAVPSHAS